MLEVLLDPEEEDQNYLEEDMVLGMDLRLGGSPEPEDMDLYFVDKAGILLKREKQTLRLDIWLAVALSCNIQNLLRSYEKISEIKLKASSISMRVWK